MFLLIWIATFSALLISYRKNKDLTLKSFLRSIESLKGLSSGVLAMIAVVGLALAIVPKESWMTLFAFKGVWGFVLVSLIGAIVTIPGPIAFPLAGTFLKMGANPSVLATFITTLTMVGFVSSPLEISYFGKRFTLIRQAFSFVAAVLIGLMMGVFL